MSLKLDFKRITREGFVAFWRNKVVSISTVVVMTMTLIVLSSLVFLNGVLDFSLKQLEDRVDVNVYFYPEVPEEDIIALADRLEKTSEIREVQYISREEAYANFKNRHEGDPLIIQSLEELGTNPLGAALNIRAYDSTRYESIVETIEADPAVSNTSFVERINYYDNKTIIDRLNQFSHTAHNVGSFIIVFFGVIALLVIMSTIRIAIYSSKREIIIKRLVGAEPRYIRGPFIMAGALYGAISAVLTMIILFFVTQRLGSYTETFFGGMNLFGYFMTNIFSFFVLTIVVGIIIGVISSHFATRKYLNV